MFFREKPRLHMSYRTTRRFPPDLKSVLIHLNNLMDLILSEVQPRFASLDESYELTDYEKIVLLLEDRKFFLHNGIDMRCIPRALKRLITKRRLGGVSTIEQQLVRTVLGFRERTFRRKAQEMVLAVALSYRTKKTETLRAYLNRAYHGYGVVGCDTASEILFGKNAVDLDRAEGSLVASLLVYPVPRQILEHGEALGIFPITDVKVFLDACVSIAPNWTRNVKRRAAYGLSLLSKAEKASY